MRIFFYSQLLILIVIVSRVGFAETLNGRARQLEIARGGLSSNVECNKLKGKVRTQTFEYLANAFVNGAAPEELPPLLKHSKARPLNQTVRNCLLTEKKIWFDGEHAGCRGRNYFGGAASCDGLQAALEKAFDNWQMNTQVVFVPPPKAAGATTQTVLAPDGARK